jgi:hypothetical protein
MYMPVRGSFAAGAHLVTAIRSVRAAEGKFVQISNAALQDRRLSLSARGLIAFALSLPPDKTFSAAWLETQVPDGRREIRSALRELQACGYYQRSRTSRGGTWIWDQVISDAPIFAEKDESASPQVSSYDRNRPHETTCENTTPAQADASGRFAPDANGSNKELKTEHPKTFLENTASQSRAPRRARQTSFAGETDIPSMLDEVRQAAVTAFGDTAQNLTDEQCAAMHDRFCCHPDGSPRKIGSSVRRYLLGGPFKDIHDLEAALRPKRTRDHIPFDLQVRYDDIWVTDEERVAIVEELLGRFEAGEEAAVGNMITQKRSLPYILAAVESGNLFTAA